MKKKLLTGVLGLGLSVALIGGATMAWFTDQAAVAEATFQAGTVIISPSKTAGLEAQETGNVNPGDTFTPTWEFLNDGTKAVKIRIIPEISYLAADGSTTLSTDNLDPIDLPDGWRSESETINGVADTLVLYYDPVIPGTEDDNGITGSDDEDARTATLSFDVTFNGAKTTNAYQGSTLTVGGIVQAIQASHEGGAGGEANGWTWDSVDFAGGGSVTP